jgi:cell division protein FtsL
MRRKLTALAIGSTLASAAALYLISYDTRRIELAVQSKERRVERATADIAVLAAERAYLARPERIEPLARALGMGLSEQRQWLRLEDLPRTPSAPDQ